MLRAPTPPRPWKEIRNQANLLPASVLDWNFEAKVDYSIMNANHEYVAAYLAELFGRLCPLAHVDVDATAFGSALETGALPLSSVRPTSS